MDITSLGGPLPQSGVGVVAPFDFALDRELWRWVPEDVSLHLTRTPFVPVEVSIDMARIISELETLRAGVTALHAVGPGAFAYACTSGSFVGGAVQEEAMVAGMAEASGGLPAITTSGAMLEALRELGVRKVAVITPYTRSVTDALEEYLAEAGIQVTGRGYLGLTGEIWKVPYREVADMTRGVELGEAEAVFVSCTNLPTYDVIPQLEAELRIPVVSANQATMWAALRRIGREPLGAYQALIDPQARAALRPPPGGAAGADDPDPTLEQPAPPAAPESP